MIGRKSEKVSSNQDLDFIIVKKVHSGLHLQDMNSMAEYVDKGLKRFGVSISKPILAAICIVAGILVILLPSLLVWTVGLLLVVQGALLLRDHFENERLQTKTIARDINCRYCGTGNIAG